MHPLGKHRRNFMVKFVPCRQPSHSFASQPELHPGCVLKRQQCCFLRRAPEIRIRAVLQNNIEHLQSFIQHRTVTTQLVRVQIFGYNTLLWMLILTLILEPCHLRERHPHGVSKYSWTILYIFALSFKLTL